MDVKKKLEKILQSDYHYENFDFLDNPEFENAGKVHDWRNYIFEELKFIWPELSRENKMIAFMHAAYDADNEEWD